MITEITAVLQALNGARQIADGLMQSRDEVQSLEIRSALLEQLIVAKDRVLHLQELLTADRNEIAKLVKELDEIKDAKRDRDRYRLRTVGDGATAYYAEANAKTMEPAHYVCQPCFAKGKKIVMQEVVSEFLGRQLVCPEDKRHTLQA